MRTGTRVGCVVVTSLVVASCGGGSSDSGSSGGISDKTDVSRAVVRIVAEGSFRDPDFGQTAFSGSGSGFLISSDGLIVTNQHVVEGAGSLNVYIEGEDRPKNARILGVSECDDLAVLDLSGDGYPFLDWFADDPRPGLDAWAAGFPLGDPEYSLTRGSVVKAEASGDSNWASIEYTIEHDANIQPGNSGGPLVSEDGRVVGVNYANFDAGTGTSQFFAIPADLAQEVVAELAAGQDREAIGVNGFAFANEEWAGLWVSGVRAGSPASDLGIEPGDVILELAGRPVITESDFTEYGATKAGYCDILRTQGSDRAMSVSILRFDTGEILSGELNNPDRPLEVEVSIANQISEGAADPGEAPVFEYTKITDDSGRVEVEVPTTWTDRSGSAIDFLGFTLPAVSASTNLEGFFDTWNTPGIIVIAAPELDTSNFDSTLEFFAPDQCDYLTSDTFEGHDLIGKFDVYVDCGGVDGMFYVVGAFFDVIYEAMVIVLAQVTDESELEVIDRALETVYLP